MKYNFDPSRVLTIIAALGLACCSSGGDEAEELGVRVDQYMTAWEDKDLRVVWSIMSDRLQESNGDNEVAFEEYTLSQGIFISDYRIRNITINGNSAAVIVDIHYLDEGDATPGFEREALSFTQDRGIWYFDGAKSMDASAGKEPDATELDTYGS